MNTLDPIVVVEDDTVDQLSIQRSLFNIPVKNDVTFFSDADEALQYFRSGGKAFLVLADFVLPGKSGLSFLESIKKMPDHSGTPVIMLTGSDNPDLVSEAYEKGAAGFFKKAHHEELSPRLQTMIDYWRLNRLPSS